MGKIVCIIGNKGGTGKTTLSHVLAHGFGLFGMRTVALLTDTYRDKLAKAHRTYLPFDARSEDDLVTAITRLRSVEDWHGIADGGGNRPEVDDCLAELADLVLLPFRESHEDLRTVRRDLERFPRAWAIPSQWPTNPWSAVAAGRAVDQLLGEHRHRVLAPCYALASTKLLLQDTIPASLPRGLNNAAREIAIQTLELLGTPVPDSAWMAMPSMTSGPVRSKAWCKPASQTGIVADRASGAAAIMPAQTSPSVLHA
jgi:chromosome partitioning protein